jgi:ABC-type nitrate/sulfonate/bicarbonate transport system permease component
MELPRFHPGAVGLGLAIAGAVSSACWAGEPIVSVGFPMPKIAFLRIFMSWLGLYDVSKISMAAFNAIFPVIVATTTTVWPRRTY